MGEGRWGLHPSGWGGTPGRVSGHKGWAQLDWSKLLAQVGDGAENEAEGRRRPEVHQEACLPPVLDLPAPNPCPQAPDPGAGGAVSWVRLWDQTLAEGRGAAAPSSLGGDAP